jgi:hypothetical protein
MRRKNFMASGGTFDADSPCGRDALRLKRSTPGQQWSIGRSPLAPDARRAMLRCRSAEEI